MAKINNKILKKLDYKKEYESLAPKDNLDKNNSYIKALKESIDDLKRKNIAISGIYGSGKSSIIESFKEQYKEYKYLDISLATFISSEDDKLEELERNILNQIFYKVSYDKMPYSRFRKIKNIRFLHIFKVTLIFISLLLTLSLLIKPELIEKFTSNILKLKGLFSTIPIVKYNVNLSLIIVMIVCSITILYITMILIKFILSKFTINKIQTKDGNLQLGKREESETFNKYLDEIMYFFESLKYDIVFFEDLDRFDNLEIFTKLRELNTLINKAESISNKVTFVYAIKDEIFFIKEDLENDEEYKYIDKKEMNKNRTKFFDFIIPVIPIVNGENSYEILSKKIEQFNKKYGEQGNIVSKELLSDLSIFIDDMRLLTNIYNEFLIYYRRLVIERKNKTLSSDNLLAIIVYKNLYPVDFAKLQNRDGMVYNIFSEKNKIADKAICNLYEEIDFYKLNIQQLEKEIVESEEELYIIYKTEWISKNINYIKISSKIYSIDEVNNIKVIEELKNANSIRYSSNNSFYNYSKQDITFENLMTVDGKKVDLYKRLIAMKSRGKNIDEKIKYNQNKIQAIEAKIKEFKSNSVATLMKDKRFFDCLDEKIKKEALIIRLLKYGYIDEMYSYYSLYFYEGRLTQKDFEFVQSVIYNKPLNCEFKLDNINEILVKFRIEDFESKAILNYDLIKFLSENIHININKMILKKIIGILSELKIEDINFIMDFIHKSGEIANFIKLLCQNINRFWNSIYCNSYLSLEKKDYILELLLKYCSIENVLIQNNDGYIKEYIELNSNFIKTIAIKIEKSKLKDILIELNIKLKDIDQDIVDDIKNQSNNKYMSVFEDIYYNDLYELNIAMVSKIIFIENKNIENMSDVDWSYSCISKNELNYLIKYIDNNINLYIRNIFIEPIVIENTETIIDILNNEEVDKDLRDNIVNIKQFKVDDINKIKNIDIWNLIFNNLKVNFSWENILSYYKTNDSIDKCLGSFINNPEVCKELLKDTLYKESFNNDEKESIDLFVEKFVMSKIISDETVDLLSCKLGSPFTDFDFEDMLDIRILVLINKKLIALSKSIYKSLKTNHYGLHINLLENNIDKFTSEKIQDFDSNDLELILKSDIISQDDKYNIVKLYGKDIELNDSLAEIIFDVIEKFLPNEKIEYKLIESIIRCNFEKEKRRKLIAYQIEFIDKMDISDLLSYIDDEYKGLLDLSPKKMYIRNTNTNMLILEKLKSKRYISTFKLEGNRIVVNRKRT